MTWKIKRTESLGFQVQGGKYDALQEQLLGELVQQFVRLR